MKKMLALVLSLLLCTTLLSGIAVAEEKEPITISYWCVLPSDKVAPIFSTNADIPLWQELEARTGVHVEWQHPPVGQETENRNLMLASDKLPDVIEWDFREYPGGALKAIDDGMILKLNDYIEEYAPNLNAFLDANPDFKKQYVLDDGTMYGFPFFRGHEKLLVFFGPIIRDDLLAETGLEIPETIDEWTEVLRAFKANGVKYPYSLNAPEPINTMDNGNDLPGAFDSSLRFMLNKEGKVVFGPTQPGFKKFIETMRMWYEEGLLDPDFATQDLATFRAKVLNDEVGIFTGYMGGGIGYFYNTTGKTTDPSVPFSLKGINHPVEEKGTLSRFGQKADPMTLMHVSISADVDEALIPRIVEWLDYGYGYDGYLLFNFGKEGVSFEWDDTTEPTSTLFELPAYPRYTEDIARDPEIAMTIKMSNWATMHFDGTGVQAPEYLEQTNDNEDQMNAAATWIASSDFSGLLSERIAYTEEEAEVRAALWPELKTYRDEMVVKFITGAEPMEKYDEFQANLLSMGAEELAAIDQAAYDRYLAR